MSFNKDIEKFNKKVDKAATNIFRGTALTLFGKIIKRTPVGDPSQWENPGLWRSLGFVNKGYAGGRLRANWFASINSPSRASSNDIDPSGSKSRKNAKAATGRAKLGDSIFLVNNLPYAGVIENGRSKQAPIGMVKVTILEFQRIANHEAKKNRK